MPTFTNEIGIGIAVHPESAVLRPDVIAEAALGTGLAKVGCETAFGRDPSGNNHGTPNQ
jgi:hypothetical protein